MMESHGDPLIRDKKKLPMTDMSSALPAFLGSLALIPIWLGVLVPAALVSQAVGGVVSLVTPKSKKSQNSSIPQLKALKNSSDTSGRIYDIVVFGATGFTGKMAAVYIAKTYGTKFRWAIAGRRRDALEKIRDELVKYNSELSNLGIELADSFDEVSLGQLASKSKVIITTAGPFSKYGTMLVQSCALYGTHYCDITGESDWVREMIDKYDDLAKESGARIVSFCGHDCVPWDLTVLECTKYLRKQNETLTEIHFYDEINSEPSGGTLDTVFHVLNNRQQYRSSLKFDPFLKTLQGTKSDTKLIVKNQALMGYSSEFKHWVGPFVMAMVMANCVRRSNAVNNYNSKLVYKEALVFPNFFSGFNYMMGLMVMGTAFYCPPLKWILRKFVLPAPGQGPSEAFMDQGFLKITGFATGSNGTKLKTMIYFPTDPGYRDTARMLVESGLTLALDGDRLKATGGVWTPATCQGEILLDRLVNTGSSFEIQRL